MNARGTEVERCNEVAFFFFTTICECVCFCVFFFFLSSVPKQNDVSFYCWLTGPKNLCYERQCKLTYMWRRCVAVDHRLSWAWFNSLLSFFFPHFIKCQQICSKILRIKSGRKKCKWNCKTKKDISTQYITKTATKTTKTQKKKKKISLKFTSSWKKKEKKNNKNKNQQKRLLIYSAKSSWNSIIMKILWAVYIVHTNSSEYIVFHLKGWCCYCCWCDNCCSSHTRQHALETTLAAKVPKCLLLAACSHRFLKSGTLLNFVPFKMFF